MNIVRTACLVLLMTFPVSFVHAESFDESVYRAEVLSIEEAREESVAGTKLFDRIQILSVRIIEGVRKGEYFTVRNDSSVLLSPGDVFYLHRTIAEGGSELWAVGEPDRRYVLIMLALVFVAVAVLAAGSAGVRALLSLVASFLAIVFGLLPALSSGAPPVITSVGIAVFMLALSMFITHKFRKSTLVALLGSVVALIFAAFVAEAAVTIAKLSGFASDETVFLNFATGGMLNLPGLLLGGILIGVVGILNDVSISQVHTVVELHDANPTLSRFAVLKKAMNVGREHLGAVINTLPLAYVGASLPLLLLFLHTDAPFLFIINREIFAAEIIRILAGGIGLMGSGVVATWLGTFFLVPDKA